MWFRPEARCCSYNSTMWRPTDRDPDIMSLHYRSHSAHSSPDLQFIVLCDRFKYFIRFMKLDSLILSANDQEREREERENCYTGAREDTCVCVSENKWTYVDGYFKLTHWHAATNEGSDVNGAVAKWKLSLVCGTQRVDTQQCGRFVLKER